MSEYNEFNTQNIADVLLSENLKNTTNTDVLDLSDNKTEAVNSEDNGRLNPALPDSIDSCLTKGQQEFNTELPKPTLESLTASVLKDLKFILSMDKKILQDQERYWLSFPFNIPYGIQKELLEIIHIKTGKTLRWISDREIEIELLKPDDLAEVKCRKKLEHEKREQELKKLIEYQKLHPSSSLKPSRRWQKKYSEYHRERLCQNFSEQRVQKDKSIEIPVKNNDDTENIWNIVKRRQRRRAVSASRKSNISVYGGKDRKFSRFQGTYEPFSGGDDRKHQNYDSKNRSSRRQYHDSKNRSSRRQSRRSSNPNAKYSVRDRDDREKG